ncbi:hypothetical protein [Nonomuraea sp. NPDC050786]|uniref:hypothetical protein n=1 Tax=Nonomuraea sp. NPDC050786 TaxID=3154840 RepID=UPI0033E8D856
MPVARTDWNDLPAETRARVEEHTGPIRQAATMTEGLNSAVAALLTTDTGEVFVKGLRRAFPRRWTQDMEWVIGPYVAEVSPRTLWRVEDDEWDLIGFEAVDGRHARFDPGSPDVALVTDVMYLLGRTPCPNLPLKTAESRWKPYMDDPDDLRWLAGDRLLHTDYNPLNVLIADGRALLIDWAWPTRGAGWIDPACLILRLMLGGHTAEEADKVCTDLPAWREAPAEGVNAFAQASLTMWREISQADSAPWKSAMGEAAEEWLQHRIRTSA